LLDEHLPQSFQEVVMTRFPHRFLIPVVLLCSGVGLALAGGDKDKKPLTNTTFVTKAAQSSLAEVELSKLALSQSKDEQVRSFAQRMVRDHEKASMELKPIAQKHGIQVPAQLDAKHAKKLEDLKAKSGADFDAEYSKMMMKDHEKAVGLFTEASKSTQLNSDLRDFASKTLPTLESHHRLANRLPDNETRSARSESESAPSTSR
jgi:putative membrane protein